MIQDKDQKILWATAAGRCSIADCRVKLTLVKSEESKAVTFGEMCHIIGEKNSKKSPRGISKLPLKLRNKYSNLILLCAHHHRIIDKNIEDYPVEILHSIKTEHELWVDESLTTRKLTPNDIVYSDVIDVITEYLHLNKYSWFIEHSVKQILHETFIDGAGMIVKKLYPRLA